ncbi:MAG: NAD(+) diphosphatase [Gemmatimonadetes bacterium]|nr:NAD(+) diphosphatase [Gemmatimonadota bacterium]
MEDDKPKPGGDVGVCLFRGNELVVTGDPPRLPSEADLGRWLSDTPQAFWIGGSGRSTQVCTTPKDWDPPAEAKPVSLRGALTLLDEGSARLGLAAAHHRRWRETSRFCGACGAPTREGDRGRAFECTACSHLMFPKISPAVIVQVTQPGQILLGRSARHPPGFYSVLAGFVDPGETLEETVAREVREESGVELRNIRYFGSQAWPFPDSLMVGFTAEYAGGVLVAEDDEIDHVEWFRATDMPPVPPPYSIARTLIDDFIVREGYDPASVPTWSAR